jgi:hypothetical protein
MTLLLPSRDLDVLLQAARYLFRREQARTGPQLDLLAALDHTTVAVDPGWC